VASVSAVIINFQTPDLTERAVRSFRRFYPLVPLLLIDNGSGDRSADALRALAAESPATTELLINNGNLHHGPAMHQAMTVRREDRILFLDSDCEVLRGGFLEAMMTEIDSAPQGYAAGKRIFMNERGFDVPESAGAIPYLRPICLLVDRALYAALPPFAKHGAPCLANMKGASERGLRLCHVPVEEYVRHLGRGTARRFGYRLGMRGKWNHLLNRLGL
jgi:glycosyltransferase involved in cell wall biosynthesis